MSECTCGAENVKLYGQHYLGCPLQPTSPKAPREFNIEPVRWTIMHPTLGGPLEVVSSSAYDQLKAERDEARKDTFWKASQELAARIAELERERDEWKSEHDNLAKFAEDLRKERDALKAQVGASRLYAQDLAAQISAWESGSCVRRNKELERQLADAEMCARGSADLVCTQREVIAILERKLADATELIERMTGGAVRRAPEDSEIAGER